MEFDKRSLDSTHIDSKVLGLVKFFIRLNVFLKLLKDKDLKKLLSLKLSKYSFQNIVIPKIIKDLKLKIEEKL
jgi:hypothetical protein